MKANIKDIPCRIIEAMLFNQREQGNKIDIMVFKDMIDAGKRTGGFDWYDTKGGSDFWADIIFEGYFDLFFADESKDIVKDLTLPYELMRIEMAKIYRHYVTKDLAATPTRIIDKMMEEQVAQGNVANVSVFDNNMISSSWAGGFDWHSTNEGEGFWHDVLIEHNFNLFDSVFSSEGKDKPIKKQTPILQYISDMNHTPTVCTADANIEKAKNNIDQYYTLKERLDGLKKSIDKTEEKLSSLICDRDECENKINEIKKQFK